MMKVWFPSGSDDDPGESGDDPDRGTDASDSAGEEEMVQYRNGKWNSTNQSREKEEKTPPATKTISTETDNVSLLTTSLTSFH